MKTMKGKMVTALAFIAIGFVLAVCSNNAGPDPDPGSTFTTPPDLTLEPDNAKITYTWTASVPAADSYDIYWKAGSGLTAADIKTGTKITGAASGGTITGLTNGTAYSVVVTANKADYTAADSDVVTATPAVVYAITGSGASFTAKKGSVTVGTADQPIQTVINAIRGDANGAVCIIHFGDGTNTLDIGTTQVTFNNTGGTWGLIELRGKITSAVAGSIDNFGTITIADNVSVTSTAEIVNTVRDVVSNHSTGTLTISGGMLQSTGTSQSLAVDNLSTGTVNISGGELKVTGNTSIAVGNDIGTVNISGGTVSAIGASGTAVANIDTGTVNISGGTISATTGKAVDNLSTGKITVSGTAKITSANITATRGTITISGTGTAERLVIEGGTVENTSTTTGNAIYNSSPGAVRITGGTVRATGSNAYAIYNTSTGVVTIGPGATIVGNKNW
jgi:hypothetical protein